MLKLSKIRTNRFPQDILDCKGSKNGLNIENATQKFPIYWETPAEELKSLKLYIYSGINDGIQSSVSITHSINFYNKLLTEILVNDSLKYVSSSLSGHVKLLPRIGICVGG